jgi:hypothetical protein
MSIILPLSPSLQGATPHLLDWAGTLTPPLGGSLQILDRLGSRHSIDLKLPPIPTEPAGRIWASRLKQAKRQGALYRFPQYGFRIGAPGAPQVGANGQAGTSLALTGFTPGYAIRDGQWFSLVTGGRRYLYSASSGAVANSSGAATVQIEPPLRISPVAGDLAEFAVPMIEGVLSGNDLSWEHLTAPYVDLGTITITEMA